MDIFLTILKYAAGPIIGAVIGYLTNWLAVKMLFRPYYPKKIGKWQLPFTPGIIPRRKGALAKAVGKAVGEQLLTKDDLASMIASEGIKTKFEDHAVALYAQASGVATDELIQSLCGEGVQGVASGAVADKIYCAACKADLGGIVAQEGIKAINGKKSQLGMISMFITDELVESLATKLGEGVNNYVANNGKQLIEREVDKALAEPLGKLVNVSEDTIRNLAGKVFDGAIKGAVGGIVEQLDISAVVENKINAMDVKELEKLVLSVMKKELNSIVNLGALIGFILGIVMIFI